MIWSTRKKWEIDWSERRADYVIFVTVVWDFYSTGLRRVKSEMFGRRRHHRHRCRRRRRRHTHQYSRKCFGAMNNKIIKLTMTVWLQYMHTVIMTTNSTFTSIYCIVHDSPSVHCIIRHSLEPHSHPWRILFLSHCSIHLFIHRCPRRTK